MMHLTSNRKRPLQMVSAFLISLFAMLANVGNARALVNGQCGAAAGEALTMEPAGDLCSSGTSSGATGTGPWQWTCNGSGGGRTASCQALVGTDPTVGVLPTYNDASANWKVAGLAKIGGIPTSWSDCTSAQAGVTLPLMPSGGDDVANAQTAIDNCPNYTVIEVGPGAFKVSAQIANHTIWINRSFIILRGVADTNTSAPYRQTQIVASPGGATQGYVTGGSNCGGCAGFAASPIYVSPSAFLNGTSYSWTGCNWGTNCDNNPSAYQLTADAVQGATQIQLNSVANLTVGMFVRIDENDEVTSTPGPNGTNITAATDLLANSGSPATGKTVQADIVNGSEYGALLHRTTSEIHLISAIGGACGATCITFDSPVTINFRVSHVAQIYRPNHPFLQQVGIENIAIVNGVGGQTGGPLHMDFCAYCWLKDDETDGWIGGLTISNSARVAITHSYLHDCSDCENNGNEYPLALDGATTESLVDDSIIRLAGKGMVGRSCGGGNVIANSYVDDTFYQASSIGNYWLDMSLNGSHYVGCHHTLFEGNWANNLDNDNTHGNTVYLTYFRNWGTGLRSDFQDPSLANPSSSTYNPADALVSDLNSKSYAKGNPYPYTPGERHAAGSMMTDYWMAFVGNVLGEPGVTCATGCPMSGWVYSNGTSGNGQHDKSIWETGWVGGGTFDPYLESPAGQQTCDGSSPPGCMYLFRHGDYDTVTASVADNQPGYSTNLPNSFYLASAPAYFSAGAACSYAWPWVTPAGTTQIQAPTGPGACSTYTGLPAKARWDAGTPFSQP